MTDYDHEAFMREVRDVLMGINDNLANKNLAYGNSALEPVRIFSKASTEEQLLVRIDDKLSRLARGSDAGEDVVHDLLGYLVLLRIAQKRAPLTQEEQGAVIEQSSSSYVYVGPFVGKRVILVLDEVSGVVTVDDGDKIVVQLDASTLTVEYPLRQFKLGLKEKWLVWVEEEQKNGNEEKEE